MAKKTVNHLDFDSLLAVNKEVVRLTKEPHEFTEADAEKLKELLSEVENRATNEKFDEALMEKASLLVYKIASGQHFKGGNKRTALVAGLVFLRKNGRQIDITDPGFVSAVDKAGMAAASLDDLYEVMAASLSKSAVERRSWQKAIEGMVQKNQKFLTDEGS